MALLQSAPANFITQFVAQDHARFFQQTTGRPPTLFEKATAQALLEASQQARRDSGAFTAVSTATGSGKTTGAAALLWHLFVRQGMTGALVISTVEECDRVYRSLVNVLPPGTVAIYTSLHKANASPKLLLQKRQEFGLTPAAHFTEDEFKAAPIVVCTHARWRSEIENEEDNGVRRCAGRQRDLIVIDEEPSLERVYVRNPEDVSELMSVLTDTVLSHEARTTGWISTHTAIPALREIHARMGDGKYPASKPQLYAQEDLVSPKEAAVIGRLTFADIYDRLGHLPPQERTPKADFVWGTVEFLKAAAQGRVFYSKDSGGAFYAYALCVPVQPNTLILDGTADLNGMYSIGRHVRTSPIRKVPDYGPLRLVYVTPPDEFQGEMRPDRLLKNRWSAERYMQWFKGYLLDSTKPGDDILVYAKERLLGFAIHKDWDESGSPDPYYCEIDGRRVHWCHFGRGRGSNRWKDCNVTFRLGDWHQPKAVTVAKIGSVTGQAFTPSDLTRLSSGNTRDPRYLKARDAHLLVTTKQDTSRIRIRHLDDDGKCQPAVAHFIDCDLHLLQKNRAMLFPGANEFELVGEPRPTGRGGGGRGPALLRDLLESTEEPLLTGDDIKQHTKIGSNNIDAALGGALCAPIVAARGWTKATRKSVGLSGKGYVLARPAQINLTQLSHRKFINDPHQDEHGV